MKAFTQILFSVMLLCAFLSIKASAAPFNNFSIPEKAASQADDFLKDYIENSVPASYSWVDCRTIVNGVQTSQWNHQKTNIADKISGVVYTFSSGNEKEPEYYTVVDFTFTQKMRTSKDDLLEICPDNFLWPVSPGKGKLLVKNQENQSWTDSKELYVIVNGSNISVYGTQMFNHQNFSRVLFSFPSYGNPSYRDNGPIYVINYFHEMSSVFLTIAVLAACGLVVCLVIALYVRKRAKKKQQR